MREKIGQCCLTTADTTGMHITSSQVALAATHSRQTQTLTQNSAQAWSGRQGPARERAEAEALGAAPSATLARTGTGERARSVGLTAFGPTGPFATRGAAGNTDPARMAAPAPTAATETTAMAGDDITTTDPRWITVARMIEAITGRPVKAFRAADLTAHSRPTTASPSPTQASPATANRPNGGTQAHWGMVVTHETTRTQTEQVHFQAEGMLHTADGRTLSLQLNLTMASSHTEFSSTQLTLGNAVAPAMQDPLVIHFEGPVGDLSGQRFAFDLHADGSAAAMPFVGSGSGFLVLDRNGNGRVDDGRELFGALSGNGFADLAALDEDGSGWIDRGDAAFQRLQVWRMGADGTTTLTALADTGVGALGLDSVATDMGLYGRDGGTAANAQLGQLRRSGLYLMESGQAGLLQHIDLAA